MCALIFDNCALLTPIKMNIWISTYFNMLEQIRFNCDSRVAARSWLFKCDCRSSISYSWLGFFHRFSCCTKKVGAAWHGISAKLLQGVTMLFWKNSYISYISCQSWEYHYRTYWKFHAPQESATRGLLGYSPFIWDRFPHRRGHGEWTSLPRNTMEYLGQ
jgi:hypothetical protein